MNLKGFLGALSEQETPCSIPIDALSTQDRFQRYRCGRVCMEPLKTVVSAEARVGRVSARARSRAVPGNRSLQSRDERRP
jgi:hypothetical protein